MNRLIVIVQIPHRNLIVRAQRNEVENFSTLPIGSGSLEE